MEKSDILSMNIGELSAELAAMGERSFRAGQIFSWLHVKKAADFSLMTDLSLELREKLDNRFYINYPKIIKRLESARDNTLKYLYELPDGLRVETVLMEYEHGNSICISTQAGCKMGCAFCASGIAGFKRDLAPSEMLSQIYASEEDSGRHIDSLVLMGIGEPLDNYDSTVKFLNLLSDKKGRGMSLRHVSLSTCGIVPKIYELAELKTGLTLSVSLHAADNRRRSELMPVNRRYDLGELMKAARHYESVTGRRVSFEYAVIRGVNDSEEDAQKLAGLLSGMNCHLNLIPVNSIKERDFSSDRKCAEIFGKKLSARGINVTVRRTLGADINAACGQLRREYEHGQMTCQ